MLKVPTVIPKKHEKLNRKTVAYIKTEKPDILTAKTERRCEKRELFKVRKRLRSPRFYIKIKPGNIIELVLTGYESTITFALLFREIVSLLVPGDWE